MMRRIERGLKRALCLGLALILTLCAALAEEALTAETAVETPAEETPTETTAEAPAETVTEEALAETPAEDQKPSPDGEGCSATALTDEVLWNGGGDGDGTLVEDNAETTVEDQKPSPDGEGAPAGAEEVVPRDDANVDNETGEETTSTVTADAVPPSPEGEGIGADGECDTNKTTETDDEGTSSVSPDGEPASPEGKPFEGETPAEAPVETPAEGVSAEPATETPAEQTPQETPAGPPVETPAEEAPAEVPVEPPAEEIPGEEAPAQTLTIRITDPEGINAAGGACRVDMAQFSAVTLEWDCSAGHDGFAVTVTGPDGSRIRDAVQSEATLTLSLAGMQPGTYAVSVVALLGEAAVAEAKLNIELVRGEGMPEGGFPDGFPGGRPSGGFSGGGLRPGGDGQAAEAAQGFSVTAGKALTSSHDSGDGSMRLYGAVELSTEAEAMTRLTLGGEALDVTLDGGAGTFTAALEDGALTLTPQADGERWTLNGFALKTLARSGVKTVNLSLGGKTVALATRPELNGRIYDGLCAAGYVSADYEYAVSAEGIRVSVGGKGYCLNDAGELTEDESISTEVK